MLPDPILHPTGGGTGLVGMWKASGHLSPHDTVVLFDTGTGFKYVRNMEPLWGGR